MFFSVKMPVKSFPMLQIFTGQKTFTGQNTFTGQKTFFCTKDILFWTKVESGYSMGWSVSRDCLQGISSLDRKR